MTSLAWLSDRRLLFTNGSTLSVCDFQPEAEVTQRLRLHERLEHPHGAMYVCDATYRADNAGIAEKFAVGGTERKVVIYDAKTLQETCCLKKTLYLADSFAHSNRVSAVKFVPNTGGQMYITGSWDNSVAIWDCRSGKRER